MAILVLFNLVQLYIYIVFAWVQYKHNNDEGLKSLVGNDLIRRRNRSNAMTLGEQFFTFLFEVWFLALCIVVLAYFDGKNPDDLARSSLIREIVVMLKTGQYCLVSAVNYYLSPPIRSHS